MRLGDEGAYVTFPSPGGDYGLSDLELGSGFITKQNGFRPLAGITVFRTYEHACRLPPAEAGFRPLAGITVFRTGRKTPARR